MIKNILRIICIAFAAVMIFLSIVLIAKTSKLKTLEEATATTSTNYTISERYEMAAERDEVKNDVAHFSQIFAIVSIVESAAIVGCLVAEFFIKEKNKNPDGYNKYR